MNEIKNYFENIVTLSEKDWEIFSSKLIRREFKKNSVLLKAGQVENYLSFIETGMVRYYIPREIDDLTFEFIFAGNFVSAYDSFLTRQPSTSQVATLTKTILWSVSFEDLQQIYAETNIGNTIGRLASEGLFINKSKREVSLLNQSAEERYLTLFKEQPHLLKHIPLKYIASYIGITPQALSRIRKRIS